MIRLKRALSLSFFLSVVACTPIAPTSSVLYTPATTAVPVPVIQQTGQQVARNLTERYADVNADCGEPSQPAFLCNGIMIRGTASNPTFHVWDNSPASIAKGGVSVSYLRKDSNFRKLAYSYTNGYILKTYFYASGKLHPDVLCFFPIDAGTSARTDHGCGAFPNYPGSELCHLSNVFTPEQWWAHYTANPSNRHSWQCAFDVSEDRGTLAAPAFAAGIGSMAKMGAESFETQNEFIVSAWANDLGRQLPLEAFFYIDDLPSGLNDAKRNQRDLMTTDNVWIPVIKITLPKSQTSLAEFTYSESDQEINMPGIVTEDWEKERINSISDGEQYSTIKTRLSITAGNLEGDNVGAGYIDQSGASIYSGHFFDFKFLHPATEISINVVRYGEGLGSYPTIDFYNGVELLQSECITQRNSIIRYKLATPATHFKVSAASAQSNSDHVQVQNITWVSSGCGRSCR